MPEPNLLDVVVKVEVVGQVGEAGRIVEEATKKRDELRVRMWNFYLKALMTLEGFLRIKAAWL